MKYIISIILVLMTFNVSAIPPGLPEVVIQNREANPNYSLVYNHFYCEDPVPVYSVLINKDGRWAIGIPHRLHNMKEFIAEVYSQHPIIINNYEDCREIKEVDIF